MRVTPAELDEHERRYLGSVADVAEVQARVLRAILGGARGSAFVRAHRLENASSVAELREQVPIQRHEDHAPYIARMMAGEPDQLFDGAADTFLETSGTTAGPKYFPARALSPDAQALARIDDDFETSLFLREHPDLSYRGRHLRDDCGRWLALVGAPPVLEARGHRTGFISGFTYERVHRAAPELHFVRPSWLRHLSGTRKLYVLARLAAAEDIRVVSGLPDAVVELARVVDGSAERFLRDVRDGTLSEPISEALAAELPPLCPDPERARALERSAARDGRLRPRHVWPRLGLLRTYRQAGMRLHGDFLREAYGAPLRDMGLHSTEGHAVAFCLGSEATAMALAIHRNFCEFVDEAGRAHLAHELEVGETYRLVLTTPHGLYRYDSRDLVRVIGDRHGVPVVELRGRDGATSLVGEKLTEVHVTDAVAEALAAFGARASGFAVVPHPPDGERRGYYELVIACEPPAPPAERLAAAFEEALGRANVWYREYRLKTGALDAPVVTHVDAGWFAALRARTLAERGEQAKQPIFWTRPRPAEWPPVR